MSFGTFLSLAWRSLANRRTTAVLTIFTVALSVMLFLGVDKIRRGAEASFRNTVSGTDVIVGARTGSVNLLLYSVFRIGEPTSNVSWESYERFADDPRVDWTIPLSLGDSHKGFRVLGTTGAYFEHFRYGGDNALTLRSGTAFDAPMDAVVGAAVARDLGYEVGDEIVISHGIVSAGFADHQDDPFTIVGVLAPTGTPVDRTVHVTLEGLDAVHGIGGTAPHDGKDHDTDEDAHGHEPTQITAFLVGMRSRVMALAYRRDVNTYEDEALTGILPGLAIQQLWSVVGAAQLALTVTAGFVVAAGLLGLLTAILTSLNERRREVAVLRAAGASRGTIFSLLVTESTLIATLGAALGGAAVFGGLRAIGPMIEARFGVPVADLAPSLFDLAILAGVVLAATLLGMVPAWRAYRNSLADGLVAKL